jgi:hypothetical protein
MNERKPLAEKGGQVGVLTFLGLHGPGSAFIIWTIPINYQMSLSFPYGQAVSLLSF